MTETRVELNPKTKQAQIVEKSSGRVLANVFSHKDAIIMSESINMFIASLNDKDNEDLPELDLSNTLEGKYVVGVDAAKDDTTEEDVVVSETEPNEEEE